MRIHDIRWKNYQSLEPVKTRASIDFSFRLSIFRSIYNDTSRFDLSRKNVSTRRIHSSTSKLISINRWRVQSFLFVSLQQTSDDEPSSIKRRSIEERIRALETLNFEKDSIIHDLQRKLDQKTRVRSIFLLILFTVMIFSSKDLNEAEQQIFGLQRDKLTLIKTLTSLQDPKASISGTDISIRAGFLSRN